MPRNFKTLNLHWVVPEFVSKFRAEHPNWRDIATEELVIGGLTNLGTALRNKAVSWEQPFLLFSRHIDYTHDESARPLQFHVHFGSARVHSQLSSCCNDEEEQHHPAFIARLNQFEVLFGKSGALVVSESGKRRIGMTTKVGEALSKLPDFAKAAFLADMLKPGRSTELKEGQYSKVLRFNGTVEGTEFRVIIFTEFYPGALDVDNSDFFYPIEVGVVIEKPGLEFHPSPEYRDWLLDRLILACKKRLKTVYEKPTTVQPPAPPDVKSMCFAPDDLADKVWARLKSHMETTSPPNPQVSSNDDGLAVANLKLLIGDRQLMVGDNRITLTEQHTKILECLFRKHRDGVADVPLREVFKYAGIGSRSPNSRARDLFKSRPGLWGKVVRSGKKGTLSLITNTIPT